MPKINEKTNAIRQLEKNQIAHEVLRYEASDGKIDGISVAGKIGIPHDRVFKTLVTEGAKGNLYVFCIPVDKELNLKEAAKSVSEKKIAMILVKDILKYTGYIRGGCSPIGMKKLYPTIIDRSAQGHEKIIVSGGAIGIQIHIKLSDLIEITHGKLDEIAI